VRQAQEHVSILNHQHALDIPRPIGKRGQRDGALDDGPGKRGLQTAIKETKADLRRLCEEVKSIRERGRALIGAIAEDDVEKVPQNGTVLVYEFGSNG
jgi:hypothetical protein